MRGRNTYLTARNEGGGVWSYTAEKECVGGKALVPGQTSTNGAHLNLSRRKQSFASCPRGKENYLFPLAVVDWSTGKRLATVEGPRTSHSAERNIEGKK